MEQSESNLFINLLDYVGQRKIIQDQAKELSHHIMPDQLLLTRPK